MRNSSICFFVQQHLEHFHCHLSLSLLLQRKKHIYLGFEEINEFKSNLPTKLSATVCKMF